MRLIEGLRLPIGYDDNDIINQVCMLVKTNRNNIKYYEIVKESGLENDSNN